MRIYLDTCCVNRPRDDQDQPRLQQEAAIVLRVLELARTGELEWVTSRVLTEELRRIVDPDRRSALLAIASTSNAELERTDGDWSRAEVLGRWGFRQADALHLAVAERAGVDYFLTTDDRLERCGRRNSGKLHVKVLNPLSWALEEAKWLSDR